MKLLVFTVLLCSLSASSVTQPSTQEQKGGKPNLSGTWVIDRIKSNAEAVKRFGEHGITLIVTHHDPELRVTRKTGSSEERLNESVYYTDGRGERNGEGSGQATDSKSAWKGNKLQRKYYLNGPLYGPSGATKNAMIEITDEWEISKDGQNLTLTTTLRSAPGYPALNVRPPDVKTVFTRS